MDTVMHRDIAEPSPDGIMQLGLAFCGAKTLLSAVELDLFTVLAEAPADAAALRRRLGLHERGARDFLDALVALGMLERSGGLYRNTPAAGLYLDRAKPTYVGGALEGANTRLYPVWGALTEALRSGKPQNGIPDGAELFDSQYSDAGAVAQFLQSMTGASRPVARALARKFPWAKYHSVIDIGAAEGAAPVEIALAHPHLTGGGYDLPAVRPIFESYVRRHGLDDRLHFHAGDFRHEALPSADVLVMGHILHDWDLPLKRELLAKAHAALPHGGALIVYDKMIDDERRTHAVGLLTSLNMLLNTQGGFDYTGADCVKWAREAGFRDVRYEALLGSYSSVVATR